MNDLLGSSTSLRLIVRDAAKLPATVGGRMEVIEGSHGDAAIADRAFDGAEAAFWLAPPDMTKTLEHCRLDFTRPAAEAIRRSAVEWVVSVAALGRGTPRQDRAGLVTASIQMDDMLMACGAVFRRLAMPSFMENTVLQAAATEEKGLFFGPIRPDRKLPFAATRDMAAVAARLLGDSVRDGQEDVPVLGPDDLSFDDQAAIMSEVLGREVRYQQIVLGQLKQQLLGRGASESFAQGYVDTDRAKNEGMDNVALRTAENTTPSSFRAFWQQILKPAVLG